MIKIRAMGAKELKQVLHLLEQHSEAEFKYSILEKFRQLYIPFQKISQLLPPKYQFLPSIYVAVSQGNVLGLIWLSQDGRKVNRWKIDQLIIDPNEFSYDVGTQLVNFVVNRYGGEGVQTFLAIVDHRYEDALTLFKSCGFRRVTRLNTFTHLSLSDLVLEKEENINISSLREARQHDREKLKNLHNDSLTPEVRLSLEKTPADFSRSILQSMKHAMKGRLYKRWVVEDCAHDLLVASLEMSTEDYKEFNLTVIISPAWHSGYESLLKFALAQVLKNTREAQVDIQSYEFNPEEHEILKKLGFRQAATAEVLVKDYWVPIEYKPNKLTSPILLFAGKTSPA